MMAGKIISSKWVSSSFLLLIGLVGTVDGQESEFPKMLDQLIVDSPESYRQELSDIYADRQYEPLWISSSYHLNVEGQAPVDYLSGAEQLGLNPQDYDHSELHWLQRTGQLFSEELPVFHTNVLARFEVVLSKNLLKILEHGTSGRLSPDQVNGRWYLQDERPPLTQIMTQAIENGIVPTLGK